MALAHPTSTSSNHLGRSAPQIGNLLREWRNRRRMSQLDLAGEADISTRHLSFLETGRSQPSREMLLHLAERLDVPLRERNTLLISAGFAPMFPERTLDDPALTPARRTIDLVLAGHEPYPALAIDRHWNLVASNRAVAPLLAGIHPALLKPPLNVLKLSLHPQGLAPRIANFGEWRRHLLTRLRHQIQLTNDTALSTLLKDLLSFPETNGLMDAHTTGETDYADIAVPFQLITPNGKLSFLSTTTIFGTPVDITLSELALESFFPADAATAEAMRQLASPNSG